MAKPDVSNKIDLAASLARVASARELAEFQARIVDSGNGCPRDLDVDLLFLTQESVLVFEQTHCMLVALAAQEKADRQVDLYRPIEYRQAYKTIERPIATRRLKTALGLVVAALVSAFLLEIADPSPMDVAASTYGFLQADR